MYYKDGVRRESIGAQRQEGAEDGYTKLALGIIQQAVEDMHWAMSVTPPGMSHKKTRQAKRDMRRDCLAFFYSGWFDTLVNGIVHPDKVVRESYRYKAAKLCEAVEKKDGEEIVKPSIWLTRLYTDQAAEQRKRRQIDMHYRHGRVKNTNKVTDKRRKEYKERVRWRKRRLKRRT